MIVIQNLQIQEHGHGQGGLLKFLGVKMQLLNEYRLSEVTSPLLKGKRREFEKVKLKI